MDGDGVALAAVVYDDDVDANVVLEQFARRLRADGIRVEGLVQQRAGDERKCSGDVFLLALDSDSNYHVTQNLGSQSECCSINPAGIAEASEVLRRALANPPELLVINKFGKLEADGGGFCDELLTAASDGIAVITTVHVDRLEAWREFCGSLGDELAPQIEALDHWWQSCFARRENAA